IAKSRSQGERIRSDAIRTAGRNLSFFIDFKAGLESFQRVCPDHDFEHAGLYFKAHVAIVKTELARTKRKGETALFAGLQGHSLKPAQLLNRSRDRRRHIVHIKLYHFISRSVTDVSNVYAYIEAPV